MGRPALHLRVRIQDTDIVLITAHFKFKLLTFPPNRFSPHDEGERARFGAYALYRRLRRRNLRTRSHPRPQSQETFADRARLTFRFHECGCCGTERRQYGTADR